MLNDLLSNPISLLFYIFALIISISIHEFSHALAADRLGDPTPRIQGRLTINPLVHLDLLGTFMLIFARFGWGKPVQFDPFNLANPRRDAALISLAGPASNVILAILSTLIGGFLIKNHFYPELSFEFFYSIIQLNLILAFFNLLPVHPLDGGKILVGILPRNTAYEVDQMLNRYGMFILIFMILPFYGGNSLVSLIIGPIVNLASMPFFSLIL